MIPILLYHSIADDCAAGFRAWSLAPALFDAHISYLRDEGYGALTVSQVARVLRGEATLPPKPVVVSFDDGLADFYHAALPVLSQWAMPATLYVVTGCVGNTSRWLLAEGEGNRPMLNWDQISAVEKASIEIGAHTHTHPQLDTLSAAAAWREIARSKWQLEEHLGHRVDSFAYPHGYHSAGVRRLVKQAGFASACAVKHAFSATHDDPFALARIIITQGMTVAQLDRLLQGQGLRIARRGEQLRTKVWRLARQSQRVIGQKRW